MSDGDIAGWSGGGEDLARPRVVGVRRRPAEPQTGSACLGLPRARERPLVPRVGSGVHETNETTYTFSAHTYLACYYKVRTW